jgi:hypothetical protein
MRGEINDWVRKSARRLVLATHLGFCRTAPHQSAHRARRCWARKTTSAREFSMKVTAEQIAVVMLLHGIAVLRR